VLNVIQNYPSVTDPGAGAAIWPRPLCQVLLTNRSVVGVTPPQTAPNADLDWAKELLSNGVVVFVAGLNLTPSYAVWRKPTIVGFRPQNDAVRIRTMGPKMLFWNAASRVIVTFVLGGFGCKNACHDHDWSLPQGDWRRDDRDDTDKLDP
jgi:hypothetical protein